MNKKFFNLLLMGALTVASIGTVSSCKDYDDDINNLQDQIDKLATASDLEAKVTELRGLISTNSSNISSLQAAVAKATTLDEVKTYIASCDFADKKYVDEAVKALEGDVTDVQTTLDGVEKQLKADGATLDDLKTRLAEVETALEDSGDDDTSALKEISDKVSAIEKALKDIVGDYSTMVTDVQLYNITGASDFDTELNFIQTTELENVFPKNGEAGDDKFTFTAGKDYVGEDSIIVRVSPVDAELVKENISLLNSQGKELNDLIGVTSVKRYNGLLTTTRAAAVNSGLWVIKFLPKSIGDDFVEAAVDKSEGYDKSILYSVAVKNTYNTSNTRRVTSEYALSLYTEIASHGYDFTVNDVNINNIHNRYQWTEESYQVTNDKVNYPTTYAEELVWLDNNRPFTSAITEGANKNAADRYNNIDARQGKSILSVEKGQPIVIDFSKMEYSGGKRYYNVNIKGFYVTLDTKFALESAPSELNAWNSYEYVGVGYNDVPATLFRGNTGTIVVKDLNNVEGDVIGFRVYAVNYDGTLTDPDGRAFYVAVGDVKTEETLSAEVTYQSVDGVMQFASEFIDAGNIYNKVFTTYTIWTNTTKDDDSKTPTFTVKYYNADKQEITSIADEATGRGNIKYVRFFLPSATDFIDYTGNNGQVYTQSMTLRKSVSSVATTDVCKITASLKKIMPTEGPKFAYKTGFDKYQYLFPEDLSYAIRVDDPVAEPKSGHTLLNQVLIADKNTNLTGTDELKTPGVGSFEFTVNNGTYVRVTNGWAVNNVSVKAADQEGSYVYDLKVNNKKTTLVDNKTEREIIGQYTYENISKRKAYNAAYGKYVYVTGNYAVPSASTENIVYCSWTKSFAIKTGAGSTWAANNSVKWAATPDVAPTLNLAKLEAAVADAARIKATATSLLNTPTFGADFASYLTANYLKIADADTQYGQIYTTGADGSINPYFVPTINGGVITMTQSNQATVAPADGTTGTIHFKYVDCFGNVTAVALPFVIKL